MGFDHIREQQISRILGKLAWWLLNKFDPRRCSLRVQDEKELHITEKDIALTLGFSHGNIIIEKRTKGNETTILLEDWKQQLGRQIPNITPTQLCKAIVECRDGGQWFKRHLAILITTMFVESNSNGYVNTYVIKNFEDVTKIGDLNWCEYVLRTLVSSKVAWTKNTAQKIIGPIIFLVGSALHQRENNEINSGGFGYGYIDEPHEPLKAIEDKKSEENEEGLQFLKMLSPQRFSDEQDLLERSTKKSKRDGSSSDPMEIEISKEPEAATTEGGQDLEQVSMVAETPLTDMPSTDPIIPAAIPIAEAGATHAVPAGEQPHGLQPETPQGDSAAGKPRSYLDTVVGSGSGTAPFLIADPSTEEVENSCPTASNLDTEESSVEGQSSAQDSGGQASRPVSIAGWCLGVTARPYGPWMVAQRKERRQGGRPKGQGRQSATGGHTNRTAVNSGAFPAGGSRSAPLEDDIIPDNYAGEGAHGGSGAGTEEQSASPTPLPAELGGQPRRANVIVSEKQIVGTTSDKEPAPMATRNTTQAGTSTSSSTRRAAEEDEHIVVRGKQGGKVISSTRVSAERTPREIPIDPLTLILEHHADPPARHDDKGDVVMDIEEQHATLLADEGAGGPPAGV
nr:uncharacterized protein LOC109154771 [Ipomoea batatas]